MKTSTLLLTIVLVTSTTPTFSQNWKVTGNGNTTSANNFVGTTDNQALNFRTDDVQRMHISNSASGLIGIGNNFSNPQSVLHINGMQNETGSLFQTTTNIGTDNVWSMSATSNFAPRFIVQNPANTYDVELATYNNGEINFFTNYSGTGEARSMSIQGGGGNLVHGQVALSNNLPLNFDAQSRLHLHKTIFDGGATAGNFIQFTNSNTYGGDMPGQNSGLQIGTPSQSNAAYIRQWEDAPLQFFAGANQSAGAFPLVRLHINANVGQVDEGFIGINTQDPTSRLDINGDLRIRLAAEEENPDFLLVGVQHAGNPNDLDVRRMALSGNANKYLAGDGSWKDLPKTADEEFIQELTAEIANQRSLLEEKDAVINDLNERLTAIEQCLKKLNLFDAEAENIESTPEETQEILSRSIEVTLADKEQIVLDQNVPNPFAERTTISYYLPDYVSEASIQFHDGMGQLISEVFINESGGGSLNVYGSDLSTGTYTYTLIADGKPVSTKRMVKP